MKHKLLTMLLAVLLVSSSLALPTFASSETPEVELVDSVVTTEKFEPTEVPKDNPTAITTTEEKTENPVEQLPEPTVTVEVTSPPEVVVEPPATSIYPTDIQYESSGTKRYIKKTYKIPEEVSIDSVIELPYQEDGYNWKNSEVILKETIVNSDTKEITESVDISSEHNDETKALSEIDNTLEYTKSGYIGTLTLDESSVEIVAGKQENYSYDYAVSEVREYPNLASNEMALVPKTITVGSRTFSLGTVDWKTTATTGSSGYSDYKTGYTAVATYTGTATASGVNTSDYIVKANYIGSVTKPAVNTNIYTVVYEGTIIPPIPIPAPPYLLFALGILLLITLIVVFFKLKSNTKIYILEHGVPRLHHRTRITPSHPIVNIEGLEECRLRIVLTKGLVNKLPERKIYLESDRNNYAVKLGNKLVVQYPPFEKPVLEISSSTPYAYSQPVKPYPEQRYNSGETGMNIEPSAEHLDNTPEPEKNPLREMLPNVWQEQFGNNIPKFAFNTSDLTVDEIESNDQVYRVFWKDQL